MENQNDTLNLAIQQVKLISQDELIHLWNVKKSWLNNKTLRAGVDNIPSYKLFGKRFYKLDEIIFYLDSHRCLPNERRGRPPKKETLENARPEDTAGRVESVPPEVTPAI